MSSSLISVIIPVFEGEEFLEEALESVVSQGYEHREILLIDDGSTDNSASIAKSFDEVRYVYQKNQGVAAARNHGIKLTQGEFICFLDQDDLFTHDKLEVQLAYAKAHPDCDLVMSHMYNFMQPGVEVPAWLNTATIDQEIPGPIPSTFFVRKTLFDKVGLFNEAFENGSDSDWLLRVKQAGTEHATVPQVLTRRRVHSANCSASPVGKAELLQQMRSFIQNRKRGE